MMVKVQVCTGYACRCGGSETLLSALEKEAHRLGLDGHIEFVKALCMGECGDGPCVRVNGEKYRGVTPDTAVAFLADAIVPMI